MDKRTLETSPRIRSKLLQPISAPYLTACENGQLASTVSISLTCFLQSGAEIIGEQLQHLGSARFEELKVEMLGSV
jgi:hypothetical protein